jgi:hypothetical protein
MAFGDLTTLADVKTWLQTGQSAFPTTDDALLTRLITAASQFIQTWLNRRIAEADYFELRDGTGGKRLQFGTFPVSSVLSLTIDGQIIPAAVSSSAAGYTFSPTQLALRGYTFTHRAQNVTVTYTAGFATTPPEIAQACIELVGLRYRERTRVGEVSKAIGRGETVMYSQKDMSDAIKTLIQQYRMMVPIAGYVTTLSSTQTDPATLAGAV